jgi:hypothetical protein
VNELFALRESLQKGTCSFKQLSGADKNALQLVVDEQERNGENPWGKRKSTGKRKHSDDTGKPKKKQKISKTTAVGNINPYLPSEVSTGDPVHEMYSEVQSDSDGDDTSNGNIWCHKTIHEHTAANPVIVRGKCLP